MTRRINLSTDGGYVVKEIGKDTTLDQLRKICEASDDEDVWVGWDSETPNARRIATNAAVYSIRSRDIIELRPKALSEEDGKQPTMKELVAEVRSLRAEVEGLKQSMQQQVPLVRSPERMPTAYGTARKDEGLARGAGDKGSIRFEPY